MEILGAAMEAMSSKEKWFNGLNAGKIAIFTAKEENMSYFSRIKSKEHADEITAGMSCTNAGYMTIDPIYMGRTISGYEQWACASRSGINMKGPPFPVVICGYIGYCKIMGWTY